MRRWDGLVDDYLFELEARGLVPATRASRQRELDRFGLWLKRRRPRPKLEEVGADHIVQYMEGRASFRARSTAAGILSHLRCMGDYLVRREAWSENPLRWMRGPKIDWQRQAPRRINRAQMLELWRTAATARHGYHRHLWVTVLSVLYGTGVRRGELVNLNLADWDREAGTLTVNGTKTRRQRQVRVPTLVWRCIEAYLPHRQNLLERTGQRGVPWLFANRDGDRVSEASVSRGVRALADRAGLSHLTLHQFRHSCASDLLEDGVHLPEIQRLLGHQTISTTVRYVQVADPQRHRAVKLHPINQMLGAAMEHDAHGAAAQEQSQKEGVLT